MPAKAPKIAQAALTDLEEIGLYIARDNPTAADKMIDELYEHIHRLTGSTFVNSAMKGGASDRCRYEYSCLRSSG